MAEQQVTGGRRREIQADPEAVARLVAERFREAAIEACRERDHFYVALSGGSTPRRAYTLLRSMPGIPWHQVRLFVGDERAVPLNHEQSNYRMIRETLLAEVEDLVGRVHPIDPRQGSLEQVSSHYQGILKEILGEDCVFDLLLLGMGVDGSTASLYPGRQEAQDYERFVVPVHDAPDGLDRISLSPRTIRAARKVWMIATTTRKTEMVARVMAEDADPRSLPAANVHGCRGEVTWFLDEASAGRLPPLG